MIEAAVKGTDIIAADAESILPADLMPLGCFHLTMGRFDDTAAFEGKVTHFFQSEDGEHHVTRRFPALEKRAEAGAKYILTCNGNYSDRLSHEKDGGQQSNPGTYLVTARNVMKTNERTQTIRESGLAPENGLAALQLAMVNNFETVYTLVFEANTITLRVDNGFAAKAKPVVLPNSSFLLEQVYGACDDDKPDPKLEYASNLKEDTTSLTQAAATHVNELETGNGASFDRTCC
jgi:hypothetical protein